jgi:hypothetical protein
MPVAETGGGAMSESGILIGIAQIAVVLRYVNAA